MTAWKHRSTERLQADADRLLHSGDYKGAAQIWKLLLERFPDSAHALRTLGTIRGMLGAHGSAVELLTRAAQLDPTSYGAHYNLALAYAKLERMDEAISAFERAIEIAPGEANAHGELGRAQETAGKHRDAISSFARASVLAPDGPWLNEVVNLKQKMCDWAQLDEYQNLLVERLRESAHPIHSIRALQISDDPHLQRVNAEAAFARWYALPAEPSQAPRSPQRHKYPHRRLRLGYLSGDFRAHPTSILIAELIERHDRARFETVGFSVGPDDRSPFRARMKKAFDMFIDCSSRSPAEIAAAVRKQAIDILIDLSGYTDHSRIKALGSRPAPIQVHYLGYPGTLACPYVDYLVVDPFVVPPALQSHYSEALCYLPATYQVSSRRDLAGKTIPSRESLGLPAQAFVFCSFNNQSKIQPATYELWLDILRRTPGSVMWLFANTDAALSSLTAYAAAHGIGPERIVPARPIGPEAHMARQAAADLLLDTFPYNGHTTTSDALWAGVPVLTYAGRSFASRVAGSLLRAHGMEDLITSSPAEYADLAVRIAQTPGMIGDLKARVIANRETHPLFDTKRFSRDFETALEMMWQRWERGEPPALLVVPEPEGQSWTIATA